jgi:hypothetical protein
LAHSSAFARLPRACSILASHNSAIGRVAPYAALLVPLHDGVDYNAVSFGATAGVDALF